MINMEQAFREYIGTAFWCTVVDSDSSEFMDSEYDIDDMDSETRKSMKEEMKRFINENLYLTDKEDEVSAIGTFVHEFWLTRNGHGSGFWDGGYVNGDLLTKKCEKYGPLNLYVGDDGKIYKD